MGVLSRLAAWLRPAPKTAEDVEAMREAERLRYEEESIRTAQLTAPPTMRDQYKWPS
jgi:hypothetical protein